MAPTLKKLENIKIFSLFLDPSLHHYTGIQSVLAILPNASVAMGLESVSQDRLEQVDGPVEAQCDSVVQEELAIYWGRQSMVANRAGHWRGG